MAVLNDTHEEGSVNDYIYLCTGLTIAHEYVLGIEEQAHTFCPLLNQFEGLYLLVVVNLFEEMWDKLLRFGSKFFNFMQKLLALDQICKSIL